MKALIIVDMQYDFMEGGALEVPGANALLNTINTLQEHYELVVATQDWHPKNHVSFASRHEGKKPFDTILLNGIAQTLWPDHCVQDTKGAQLHKEMRTGKVAAIFRKGMNPEIDSYSAFFDNQKEQATGLDFYLKGMEVTAVDVCGLAAEYCVYNTAKDALDLGFDTSIVKDATQAIDWNLFEVAAKKVLSHGGKIV